MSKKIKIWIYNRLLDHYMEKRDELQYGLWNCEDEIKYCLEILERLGEL